MPPHSARHRSRYGTSGPVLFGDDADHHHPHQNCWMARQCGSGGMSFVRWDSSTTPLSSHYDFPRYKHLGFLKEEVERAAAVDRVGLIAPFAEETLTGHRPLRHHFVHNDDRGEEYVNRGG